MSVAKAAPQQFQVTLRRHTGILVLTRTRSTKLKGTLEQLEHEYRAAQRHNYTIGWWGVLSLLALNWIAIFGNRSAIAEVRKQAALTA